MLPLNYHSRTDSSLRHNSSSPSGNKQSIYIEEKMTATPIKTAVYRPLIDHQLTAKEVRLTDRKTKRKRIFDGQTNLWQSTSLSKPQGDPQIHEPVFERRSQDIFRYSTPANDGDLQKTFVYSVRNQPLHMSQIVIKQRQGSISSQPHTVNTKSGYHYFNQLNEIDLHTSCRYFLEKTKFQQMYRKSVEKGARKVSPEGELRKWKQIMKGKRQSVGMDREKYMPPWMQELSQKLYDEAFKNQKYYAEKCKHGEKDKRSYFEDIIKQSRFASQVLTPVEIEALFQELKHTEPMPYWRNRVTREWSYRLARKAEYDRLHANVGK